MTNTSTEYRYFISYSGIKLPLKLVNEISLENIQNRNTFYRCLYDDKGNLSLCQKIVYGEVSLEHKYIYDNKNTLIYAKISEADESRELFFN